MFTLTNAKARIVESGQKYAETAQDDSTRRVLKTDLRLAIDLTPETIKASEALVPFLAKVTSLVAGEDSCPGLDVVSKVKIPVCAVKIDALDEGKRKDRPAFAWNAVEVRGRPKFKIDGRGEGVLEITVRVTTTKTDMQRLVDWLDADAAVTVEESNPAGPGVDDDGRQTTIGDAIEESATKIRALTKEMGADGVTMSASVRSIESARGAPEREEHEPRAGDGIIDADLTEPEKPAKGKRRTRGQKAVDEGKTVKTTEGEEAPLQ